MNEALLLENKFHIELQLFAQGPGGEKTEKPTPRRRRRAREKGQVAKSQELNTSFIIFSFTIMSSLMIPYFFHSIYDFMFSYFGNISKMLEYSNYSFIFFDFLVTFFKITLPIVMSIFLISFLANILQVGFLFTTQPLKFDLNRINPILGFKRIFSMRSFFEFLKALFKVAVIGTIIYLNLRNKVPLFIELMDMGLTQSVVVIAKLIFKLMLHISIFLIFLGIMDYLYQRYEHEKSLKMSVKELKDDIKETEGDPHIKQEIRRREQMLIRRRRMLKQVPEATVVITNPTHYAVALKYEEDYLAPIVIAKGIDNVALLIKRVALENGVPVVEDKPLARVLYEEVEIGEVIPEELYEAVAIIISRIQAMNQYYM